MAKRKPVEKPKQPTEQAGAGAVASADRALASQVKSAYVKKLGQRVLNGEQLTRTELDFLDEQIAQAPESADRTSVEAPTPTFVKTQVELAGVLGVDRRTISRWMKQDGNPGARSNGQYHVAEWKEWAREQGGFEGEDIDASREKAQILRFQKFWWKHRLSVANEEFVSSIDVEKGVAAMIQTAKTVLLAGPASLAPQLVGVSIPEAETILKDWLHGALAKLQSNPLGKDTNEK